MSEILLEIYAVVILFTGVINGITILTGDGPKEIENLWDWVISSILWPKYLFKALFKFLTSNWK